MIPIMRTSNDCEIAALATACCVTYEQSAAAFAGLPGVDPVRGNPEALYLALVRLGKWKRNITWADLEARRASAGNTCILIHDPSNPILHQHWIVLADYCSGGFMCYWGYPLTPERDPQVPVFVDLQHMKDLFLKGWPNCAFEVIQDTAWLRFKRWIGVEK